VFPSVAFGAQCYDNGFDLMGIFKSPLGTASAALHDWHNAAVPQGFELAEVNGTNKAIPMYLWRVRSFGARQ
jgi:hypothetical protein